MKLLLDTHTFLWWITDDPRLSSRVQSLIADKTNELWLSVASAWEIAIKAQLGRLRLPDDAPQFVITQLALNAIQTLPIQRRHALHVYKLPLHHRDPFDRLLVAQSKIENLPLVTADAQINEYAVDTVW